MTTNVISYIDMCRLEGAALQQGMNFGLGRSHSVILMSTRAGAPYRDYLEDGGSTLIYEGHDTPRSHLQPEPKLVDQPLTLSSGSLTQNGKFFRAAQAAKTGECAPERVKVYEKIRAGIWTYNGVFHLVDAWQERDKHRTVFKFKLVAVEGEDDDDKEAPVRTNAERRRVIPSDVKLQVWQRDGGKCAICGAVDELQFDHVIPFSKGGSSITANNVQLLCARHNLTKRDRIQ